MSVYAAERSMCENLTSEFMSNKKKETKLKLQRVNQK